MSVPVSGACRQAILQLAGQPGAEPKDSRFPKRHRDSVSKWSIVEEDRHPTWVSGLHPNVPPKTKERKKSLMGGLSDLKVIFTII